MNNLYTLEGILQEAIDKNAADINITTNEYLSFRVAGDIEINKSVKYTSTLVFSFIEKLTSSEKTTIDLFQAIEQDGSYIFQSNNGEYSFRYNISLSKKTNAHISIRKLINQIPTFEEIQLDDVHITPFVDNLKDLTTGLYLIVGATGSGKSTTIVTILDTVMKLNKIKVVTLEAPIEYYFNSASYEDSIIVQKEVGRDTLTFDTGLRAAMRQNPDVIFVGEIRDRPTAEAALQAALTGHVVVATLHAKSVDKTKQRLNFLLDGIIAANEFDFLRGIVFQKLKKTEENKIIATRDVWLNADIE